MTEVNRPKIVFLYSEIADYFINCAKTLSQSADVLIVRWPVNNEAPFKFDFEGIQVVEKKSIDNLSDFVHDFNPDILVVSGWMDKEYMKVAKSFKKKIKTIITLDNHWSGNLKQKIWTILAPLKLHTIYTHAWVPGNPQEEYAKKLGFKNILKNFYVANVTLFSDYYELNERNYSNQTILYVGRYVEHKGIFELWDTFSQLSNQFPSWKLKCIGTGEEWKNRKIHDNIEHLGFLQPEELAKEVAQASFVVIPSKFEPWGVIVQEMAISGMPILVSEKVGAKDTFVTAQNGNVFSTNEELSSSLVNMMSLTPDKFKELGVASHKIGVSVTPEIWSNTILNILDN